jgi:hypothetical protein
MTTVAKEILELHHESPFYRMSIISVQQDQQDALFVFSLLRINILYMFRALSVHHQAALHTQQLVYFVCIMSEFNSNPASSQPT